MTFNFCGVKCPSISRRDSIILTTWDDGSFSSYAPSIAAFVVHTPIAIALSMTVLSVILDQYRSSAKSPSPTFYSSLAAYVIPIIILRLDGILLRSL